MNKDIKENIILEEFDNEFSFKKNKSNLKILSVLWLFKAGLISSCGPFTHGK